MKLAECKNNNRKNWPNYKSNTRTKDKLFKRITQTNYNCNKPVSASWGKWDKQTIEDSTNWFRQSKTTTSKENKKIKFSMKKRSLNKLNNKKSLTKFLKIKRKSMKMSNKESKIRLKGKSNSKNKKTKTMSKFSKNKTTNPKQKKDTKKHNTTSNKETCKNKNTD